MDPIDLAKNIRDGFLQFPGLTLAEIFVYIIVLIPTFYALYFGAPFVPTHMKQVERMLKAADLKPGMILYDLGAGDGRLVHHAVKDYGVRAIGFEFSPLVWLWSKILAVAWRNKGELRFGNFWKKNISDADVVVTYLLPGTMKKIHEILFPQLKPGTLVISHAFAIPDVEAFKKIESDKDQKLGPIWIYKKT